MRNDKFTKTGFPVDVLWMDIEYAQDRQYFVWNERRFPSNLVQKMNKAIEDSNRRLVVIIDPHIKVSETSPVYLNGTDYEGNTTQY